MQNQLAQGDIVRVRQLQAKFLHLWHQQLLRRKLERQAEEYCAQKARSKISRAWTAWKTQHRAGAAANLHFVAKAFARWRKTAQLLVTERTAKEKAGKKRATTVLMLWENALAQRAKEKLADEYRRKVKGLGSVLTFKGFFLFFFLTFLFVKQSLLSLSVAIWSQEVVQEEPEAIAVRNKHLASKFFRLWILAARLKTTKGQVTFLHLFSFQRCSALHRADKTFRLSGN